MHVEKQLLEPYMLEPVEHKVSLYVKPEERQPSNLSRDRISHSTNCSVTTFPQFQVLLQNYLVYIHRPKKKRILTQRSHYWQLNLGYATEVLKWCKHKGKKIGSKHPRAVPNSAFTCTYAPRLSDHTLRASDVQLDV